MVSEKGFYAFYNICSTVSAISVINTKVRADWQKEWRTIWRLVSQNMGLLAKYISDTEDVEENVAVELTSELNEYFTTTETRDEVIKEMYDELFDKWVIKEDEDE